MAQQPTTQPPAAGPSVPSAAVLAGHAPWPTADTMEAVVHAYVRALNEGHVDRIVALYAEDAQVEDPVGSVPKRGLDEIRAFYVASTRLELEVALEGPIRAVGNEAAFAFSVSFDARGRRTTIRPIDLFRFDTHGRIVQMRAFFGAGNISVD